MPKSKNVRLVEVGLRDGLQNESTFLSVQQRYELLRHLISAGSKNFELGAFVSPKWVPQMQGTEDLVKMYLQQFTPKQRKKWSASVLVPNEVGMLKAINLGVSEVAVFISSTESFSQKNINCSIKESLQTVKKIISLAKQNNIKVRGYLSVCFGCPYEGKVSEAKVIQLAKTLYQMGCYEVSIGDTIGIAHPQQVESLFKKLKKVIPIKKLAAHFHDTRGLAIANIAVAYNLGVSVFDSSIAGLGGCPYAKGSSGNVSTEDVVHFFERMKVKTGLNLEKLIQTNVVLRGLINHPLESKVSKALGN